MPGPYESVLYVQDRMGGVHELINQARAAAYLADPALALDGLSICDIADFGGCEAYANELHCGDTEGGWFDFPGVFGNVAHTPDAAALDITANLCVVAKIRPVDGTPAAINIIAAKMQLAAQFSWAFYLNTAGTLQITISSTGANQLFATSTVSAAIPDGTWKYVAFTYQSDNGAGGRSTRFWLSDNGTNWTQLGTTVTTAGVTPIFSGTSRVEIGSFSISSLPFNGDIAEVSIRTGTGPSGAVGGTEVFAFTNESFHGIAPSATSMPADTGQTITIDHAGGTPVVVVPAIVAGDWVPLTFDTPTTDLAPWYNANYPQSADALGFYIAAWTGLDDGHLNRSSAPIGGYGGGSRLSPLSSDGRVMKLNIIIFGRSNEATEYLFRWLAAALSSVCSTCDTNSILIRRYCPSGVDLWDGLVQLRRVGLVEGLKWEADLVERGACYMRQASFALEAGDPCMYLPDTDRPVNAMDADADVDACLAGLTLNPDREFCRPSCSELTANCRTIRTFEVDPLGVMAPVITWDNTQNSNTYPFRAIIYADPGETGAVPNPCGLRILGELYVRALPPSSSMRWDIVGRTVEYRDHTTGGWVPGWAYTTANDPPTRRFFALPCGVSQLVMEPASMCAEEVDADTFTLDGVTYDPPRFPTVSIKMQERISCS